jgi:hypothetical protein
MKYFIYLFIVIVLIACNNSSTDYEFRNVPKSDTTCIDAINRAKEDITNGKLSYCQGLKILYISGLRSHFELDSLLRIYRINTDVAYSDIISSDKVYEGQTQGCYCDYMRYYIDKKYGKYFIDSLIEISDSIFLVNNINDTLFSPTWDTKPNYASSLDTVDLRDFSETLQEDIDSILLYPKGYKKRPNVNTNAFVDINFVVDKSGSAAINSFDFTFDIEDNFKYKKYFERIISANFRKTGWTPATIRNTSVISEITLRFYFN